MKTLLKLVSIILSVLGISAGITYASTLASPPAVFETYLSAQEGTSDTSFTLASVALRDGTTLTGYQCFTIDSNSSALEYECGTMSGTSVTNILRGIDAVTGTSSVASLKFTHRRGADVKVTDYPSLTQLVRMLNGSDTIPGILTYFSHPCTGGSASTTVCDKNYIDNQIVAAGVVGNTSVAGIFLQATGVQAASTTGTGVYNSVTYNSLLGANLSTSTPGSSAGLQVIMSQNDGKLSPNWLNGSAENYTLNGTTALATTTSSSSTITTANVRTLNVAGVTTFSGSVFGLAQVSSTFTSGDTIAANDAVYLSTTTSTTTLVSSPTITDGLSIGTTGQPKVAQSFTETSSYHVFAIAAQLFKTGSPTDNIEVDLQSDSAGSPSGTVLASSTIPASSLTGSFATSTAYFSTPYVTTASTKYWIVWSRTGTLDNSNNFEIAEGTGVYANGNDQTYNGSTWTNRASTDLSFYLYSATIAGRAYDANASANSTAATFIGFANTSATAATAFTVTTTGSAASSGLTPGLFYYLNNTPGSISSTPGTVTRKVGIGIDATHVLVTNIW